MHNRNSNSIKSIATALGLAVCLLANGAGAQSYFDVNGATVGSGAANAGSYSWEDPNWSTSPTGTFATANWMEGSSIRFAAFTDAAANNYTVTANANHTFAGLVLQADGGGAVTLNGSGVLSIASGVQGFQINGLILIVSGLSGLVLLRPNSERARLARTAPAQPRLA